MRRLLAPKRCIFLLVVLSSQRGDVAISGNVGSFENMRLTGTFTHTKLKADDPDYHQYLVNPNEWKTFVTTNKWLKGVNVDKHPTVEVLKCKTLQKEVVQKPILLKQHYALPDNFNDNLKMK